MNKEGNSLYLTEEEVEKLLSDIEVSEIIEDEGIVFFGTCHCSKKITVTV